ncbi:MAG: hypothetical protein KF764_20305 [Labilithrix sp.]|nr:hypothetical protein [Labilithrix sp.]
MKLAALLSLVAVSLAALSGCSGGDGEIAVDAATSALTAEGNDELFTIRIVEAREGGYALSGLVVKAIVDGKDPLVVSCATSDANGNGVLDKDDKLTCKESGTNDFDASLAGKEIDVELYATIEDKETKVGAASWTPAK